MDVKLNRKSAQYVLTFKNDIKNKLDGLGDDINHDMKSDLLKFVFDYPGMVITPEDLQKRKRIKNSVPQFNRCCARRANGEQCTRRKKDGCEFCGTHCKGIPHGQIECSVVSETTLKKKETWLQDFAGIQYFIDSDGNVYNPSDVLSNKVNPEIIAEYEHKDDKYVISKFLSV